MTYEAYNDERSILSIGLDVPAWIEQDITAQDVAAIEQGGCSSGAYMPAVTYYDAVQTMSKHGNNVLQYIQDQYGELPKPRDDESWSGMAVFYLSVAVELWAGSTLAQLDELAGETAE